MRQKGRVEIPGADSGPLSGKARKLLVAFGKYVTAGVVIEGATMKTV